MWVRDTFWTHFSLSCKITISMIYLPIRFIVLKLFMCNYVSKVYWIIFTCEIICRAVSSNTPGVFFKWFSEWIRLVRISSLYPNWKSIVELKPNVLDLCLTLDTFIHSVGKINLSTFIFVMTNTIPTKNNYIKNTFTLRLFAFSWRETFQKIL